MHVHTPETKLNDQYSVNDRQDKWDLFCEKLEDSDIFVFGITDYFSMKNYRSLLENFKRNTKIQQRFFLPNIDFRTESKNDKDEHIQFHVIFSNKQETLNLGSPDA